VIVSTFVLRRKVAEFF